MLKALIWHISLLLTFRHRGDGLPAKHLPTLLFLIILSAVMAAVKSGVAIGLVHGFILLLFASFVAPLMVAGWALMSVGFDVLSMITEYLTVGRISIHSSLWNVYELSLITTLYFRIDRSKEGR